MCCAVCLLLLIVCLGVGCFTVTVILALFLFALNLLTFFGFDLCGCFGNSVDCFFILLIGLFDLWFCFCLVIVIVTLLFILDASLVMVVCVYGCVIWIVCCGRWDGLVLRVDIAC